MATLVIEKKPKYERIINVLAIAIPVAVAVLLGIRQKIDLGEWTKVLPHVIGVINSLTAVFCCWDIILSETIISRHIGK
jgi:putative membrane protein